MHTPDENQPLNDLDQWDEDLLRRYPYTARDPSANNGPDRPTPSFRQYTTEAHPRVKEFYRLNHRHQTVEFVRRKRREFLPPRRCRMSVWEALETLNQLVDDSDPDTELPQIAHAMQTAEQIRADGHPRWFILAGLIHDVGKMLCLWGEPQWAVVGDTFPVGCRFSDKIVHAEFFADNPDSQVPEYQTETGIYQPGCGLDQVLLSWGHDEYIYQVTKDYLPVEAQYMLRYHSFYPAHQDNEYQILMDDQDRRYFRWVRAFQPYDLYTKHAKPPDVQALRPYYEALIAEFFPDQIPW